MARDFIRIDTVTTSATHSRLLLAYKDALRDAYQKGKYILGIMNHNQDGSNFGDIEGLFGLPTGKGQTVYDLINGSIGAMEGTFQNSNGRDLTETLG